MKKKILAVVMTIIIIFAMQAAVFSDTADTAATPSSESVSVKGVKNAEDYKFTFETVAENSEAKLLIDKSVNALRLVSKKTGKYFDTKVMNGQTGNDFIKNIQKSDFSLTYYKDKQQASVETIDNYTKSVALKQVAYSPVKDGVRCTFTVGEPTKVRLSMFPMNISKDRMENLVLKYLSDSEKAELLDSVKGYYTETKEKFIRNWDAKEKDGSEKKVAIPKLKRVYKFFYEKGKYTPEELAADNTTWGIKEVDSNLMITVVVDYMLDGRDLVVRVPTGSIVTDKKHPVSDLTLTPYLMSSDIYDNGYLFVPDGSGGIINFNTGNTYSNVLSIPIYGSDVLKNPFYYSEPFVQSTLPVIGIKKNDTAILGIIEEGAELATVTGNVSGKVDEFNKVNVKFDLYYMEKVPLTVGTGNSIIKYAQNPYKGNITMRYVLLDEDNASYTGMAKAYKGYLEKTGNIKKNPVPEQAPLFVEMIASVPKSKSFLGIPYTSYTSMTSFKDVKDIVEEIKKEGINNTVVQYTDWANGGVRNTPLNRINALGSIGGNGGLKDLLSYAKNEKFSFFPEIKLLTTYSTWGISGDITRLLNNTKAALPCFNMVTRQTNHINQWLVSPGYLPKYSDRVISEAGKLGIDNIALGNAGTLLYGDYGKNKQMMRSDAVPQYREAFEKLSRQSKLMFTNANSYALAYAGYIADLPTYGSGRRTVDYSVPFVQMVLENDIPYSMEAFNTNSLQGIDRYLLKAIETKSSPKWILTQKDESEFREAYLIKDISMKPYFQTKFSRWKGKLGEYYKVYNEFYQRVKDAEIKSHEVLSSDLVKVVYSNNLTVYINYGEKAVTVDGTTIQPLSHTILKK